MAANFSDDLARGQKAEKEFMRIHPLIVSLSKDRKWDFDCVFDIKMELKTDFYDPHITPNIFIERWSDVDKGKPGGMWQSMANEVDIYSYWFPQGRFWMEFRQLDRVTEFVESLRLKETFIKNQSYMTSGYLVPRELLVSHYDIYCY